MKIICEQCGTERQPAKACIHCYPATTPQQDGLKLLRREIMLAIVTNVDPNQMNKKECELIWEVADRIAKTEPKD